jgi:hypothetical protein
MEGGARWPRIAALAAAAIQLISSLPDLAALFADASEPRYAIVVAKIALAPVIAFAALYFAVRGPLRYVLIALAALSLLTWASFLPAFRLEPPNAQSGAFGLAVAAYQLVLAPLIAGVVVVLALSGKRPALATLLAVVPTLVGVLAVAAFAINVLIYGF